MRSWSEPYRDTGNTAQALAIDQFLVARRESLGRCFGPGTEVLWRDQTDGSCLMKILVVDDHVLIRDALRGVLKELKGDAVVLEAGDSRQTQ